MRLVHASQFIGDGPDEAGLFVYISAETHCSSPSFFSGIYSMMSPKSAFKT
jgi:hypothetical protein